MFLHLEKKTTVQKCGSLRCLALTGLLLLSGSAFAQSSGSQTTGSAAKAQELLKQARAALGGEAKMKAVQTLSASFAYRWQIEPTPGRPVELTGDLEFELLLPDKYRKTSVSRDVTWVEAFDGQKAWDDVSVSSGTLLDGAPVSPQVEAAFQRRVRAEFARLMLVPGAFHRGGAQINLDRRAAEFEIADNLDLLFGNHGLRTGALLEITRQHSRESNNANGTFIFASLDAFRAGRPTTFTQRVGEPEIKLTQYQLGWYGQDDWRVSKSFSLSFGLRHELQNHLRGKDQERQREQHLKDLKTAGAPAHVQTIFLYETRHFVMDHRPEIFDRLLADFIAGRKLPDSVPAP